MIAELGLAALWLAAALSLLQLGLGIAALKSSPAFAGEGDRAQHGGGALLSPENPSTALRAVPLPCKCRGGIYEDWRPKHPAAIRPSSTKGAPAA